MQENLDTPEFPIQIVGGNITAPRELIISVRNKFQVAMQGNSDNNQSLVISASTQMSRWKKFITSLSAEELDIVAKTKTNLHSLILGAYRGKGKHGSYAYSQYKPHPKLTRETRSYILSSHPYTQEEGGWLKAIARDTEDPEDIRAIGSNNSLELLGIIVSNEHLPDDIQQDIIKRNPGKKVLLGLSQNPHSNEHTMQFLLNTGDDRIIFEVLNCNKRVDLELLLKYWGIFCDNIHFWRRLLSEANCPEDKLMYIYQKLIEKIGNRKDENIFVLRDLADKLGGHPNFPDRKRMILFDKKIKLITKKGDADYAMYDKPGEKREEDIPF